MRYIALLITGMIFIVVILFTVVMIFKGQKKRKTGGYFLYDILNFFTLGMDDLLIRTADEKRRERKMNEALLKTEQAIFCEKRKQYFTMWMIVFLGSITGVFFSIENLKNVQVKSMERPGFGQEKKVDLLVEGLPETDMVHFSISGQSPVPDEMKRIFNEAFVSLQDEILNENKSFDEVRSNLDFPNEMSSGIMVEYESRNPEVVSARGFITAEEVPDTGLEAVLMITLKYRIYSETYSLHLRVLSALTDVSEREQLEALIQNADRNGLDQEKITLPEMMDGMEIVFREKRVSPYPVILLSITGAGAFYAAMKDQKKKACEKRAYELKNSYPGMLTKLNTLISAGMSTRSAWLRITEDYRVALTSGCKTQEFIYEEMMISARQLMNGQPEGETYVRFGKRCGDQNFVRFGNILSKNLRQGISGLRQELQTELQTALGEKKQNALRHGEEAGTKMLLPMVLMLGVVLVTVAAPAFLAF